MLTQHNSDKRVEKYTSARFTKFRNEFFLSLIDPFENQLQMEMGILLLMLLVISKFKEICLEKNFLFKKKLKA
jgi:hypothetical protein